MKAPRNAAKQCKFEQRDTTETQYNDSEKRPETLSVSFYSVNAARSPSNNFPRLFKTKTFHQRTYIATTAGFARSNFQHLRLVVTKRGNGNVKTSGDKTIVSERKPFW